MRILLHYKRRISVDRLWSLLSVLYKLQDWKCEANKSERLCVTVCRLSTQTSPDKRKFNKDMFRKWYSRDSY